MNLRIEMSDGIWEVPVFIIARHRAKYYAHEFGGDVERSLVEDTNLLFESDPFEIEDWARNNMNWTDVARYAVLAEEKPIDRQEAWVSGNMAVR